MVVVTAAAALGRGCRCVRQSLLSHFPWRHLVKGDGVTIASGSSEMPKTVETMLQRSVVFGVVLLILNGLLIGLFAFPGSVDY